MPLVIPQDETVDRVAEEEVPPLVGLGEVVRLIGVLVVSVGLDLGGGGSKIVFPGVSPLRGRPDGLRIMHLLGAKSIATEAVTEILGGHVCQL